MNSVAVLACELEADMHRERASTVGSVSLEEQYEQLSAVTSPLDKLTTSRRSSTMSRVFVDLVEDECNPTCVTEASDLSTECSDNPTLEDVAALDSEGMCELVDLRPLSVHVDIDPEDDDVYFSTHLEDTQMQQDTASICEQSPQVQQVYVDIDEENDDAIFFSTHKCEQAPLAAEAAKQAEEERLASEAAEALEAAKLAGEEYLAKLAEEERLAREDAEAVEAAKLAEEECLAREAAEAVEAAKLAEEEQIAREAAEAIEAAKQLAAEMFSPVKVKRRGLPVDEWADEVVESGSSATTQCSVPEGESKCEADESVTDVILRRMESVRPRREHMARRLEPTDSPACDSSAPVLLRPVACESSEEPAVAIGSMAPGVLADLRGGRAQRVRKYLERKLEKGPEEHC